MPRAYAQHHDEVLINFLDRKQELFSFVERNLVALTKDHFLMPVTILSKIVPSIAKGIEVAGFLKEAYAALTPARENIFCLASSHDEVIYGLSQNAENILKLEEFILEKELKAGLKI